MSLGYNHFRVPVTNLPGSVGANVIVSTRSRRPSKSSSSFPSSKPNTPSSFHPSSIPIARAAKEAVPHVALDEHHWTYATVAAEDGLRGEDSEVVARCGERVLLVYPMETHSVTGNVRMRVKRVHPVSGQMSYTWVDVYQTPQSSHLVKDWSFLP